MSVPTPEPSGDPPLPPHPLLRYSTLRILVFVGCLAVSYLLGLRGLLLIAVALVASGLLSYVLLTGHRNAVSASVARRVRKIEARLQGPDDVDER